MTWGRYSDNWWEDGIRSIQLFHPKTTHRHVNPEGGNRHDITKITILKILLSNWNARPWSLPIRLAGTKERSQILRNTPSPSPGRWHAGNLKVESRKQIPTEFGGIISVGQELRARYLATRAFTKKKKHVDSSVIFGTFVHCVGI